MTRGAFTLLEVLAALVVLGMLAVAAVPLQQRVNRRHQQVQDLLAAQTAIAVKVADPEFRLNPQESAVAGHTDWMLRVALVAPDAALGNPDRLGRRWYQITVHRQAEKTVLAEKLVVAPIPLTVTP